MPYRTSGGVRRVLVERDELRTIEAAARARRLRAGVAMAAILLAGAAGVVVLGTRATAAPRTRCHHVEVRRLNDPGRPPDAWTSCTERPADPPPPRSEGKGWRPVLYMTGASTTAIFAIVRSGHS